VNNIIHQICENYISEVLNFFNTRTIRTLDEMETELREKTDCYLRNMIKVYLEGLDEAIAEDKVGRKKKGYVIEQKAVKREIYTQFGNLEFRRRYYKNKFNSAYSYLVDKVVGIENYDRVSSSVSVALVESASEMSYAKSI
jgi:cation transport regulator ChaB